MMKEDLNIAYESSLRDSKIHKQKMEEIERERERIKKVMQNTDELSEREEGMDNMMVSYRI